MELKKSLYFTIDSIIAGGIILIFIGFFSSFYLEEQSSFHLSYFSQDFIRVLGTIAVRDIDNNYIKSLINDGTISNPDNTVLEQIGEFWAENEMVLANKTASNVTSMWVYNTTGIGIWVNNQTIYNKDLPLKKSLVSSKKIVSGIKKGVVPSPHSRQNPPTLWGPAIVEVRVWE